ncbi:MAG: glycosyltransferase [Bacteroidales bacterium]|nr:glycosyltransferase [Bacteroidales bacterium]
MVDVSIVIVCMNRMDNLYPCLASLHQHTRHVSYETFVVAYLFNKENLARAREDFPWVTFIESDEIRGFAENNNLALRKVNSRYCFVLNDDTEMNTNVIGKLVADMDSLPERAAIVSPTLVNADGTLQLCGRPEFSAWKYVRQQFHCYREPIDTGLIESTVTEGVLLGRPVRTTSISGAAFLIKTDVFRRIGWFDERYFFTPEDMALASLVRAEDYTIWVDADVHITHKWRTTASRMMSATRPAAVRGSLIYFSEWRRPTLPAEGDRVGCYSPLKRSLFAPVRYLVLGSCVWVAEMSKLAKAWAKYRRNPIELNRIPYITFRNITRSIFTTRTPKEIFTRYYNELKK